MQSEYARDLADKDEAIVAAAKERKGKPIKLRVQPMVLREGGQYQVWKDVRWTVECDTPQEAYEVRDAMKEFFATMPRLGAKAVIKILRAAEKESAA